MTHNDGKQLDYTLTASVFLSFLGIVLVLSVVLCVKFWALRKYHPISGRSPVLALLEATLAVLFIVAQTLKNSFSFYPCWLTYWHGVSLEGIFFGIYFSRIVHLIFSFETTIARSLSEGFASIGSNPTVAESSSKDPDTSVATSAESTSHQRASSVASRASMASMALSSQMSIDLNTMSPKQKATVLASRLGQEVLAHSEDHNRHLWYLRHRRWFTESALVSYSILIFLLWDGSFAVLFFLNYPNADIEFQDTPDCTWSEGDRFVFVSVVSACLIITWLSYRMREVVDGMGIKDEFRVTGWGIIVFASGWIALGILLPDFNHEVFPTPSVCILLGLLLVVLCAIGWPLYLQSTSTKVVVADADIPEALNSLSQVLRNPKARERFRAHVIREFSVENLVFWEEVQRFRRVARRLEDTISYDPDVAQAVPRQRDDLSARCSHEDVALHALYIFNKFIESGSPLWVNIASHVRAPLELALLSLKQDILAREASGLDSGGQVSERSSDAPTMHMDRKLSPRRFVEPEPDEDVAQTVPRSSSATTDVGLTTAGSTSNETLSTGDAVGDMDNFVTDILHGRKGTVALVEDNNSAVGAIGKKLKVRRTSSKTGGSRVHSPSSRSVRRAHSRGRSATYDADAADSAVHRSDAKSPSLHRKASPAVNASVRFVSFRRRTVHVGAVTLLRSLSKKKKKKKRKGKGRKKRKGKSHARSPSSSKRGSRSTGTRKRSQRRKSRRQNSAGSSVGGSADLGATDKELAQELVLAAAAADKEEDHPVAHDVPTDDADRKSVGDEDGQSVATATDVFAEVEDEEEEEEEVDIDSDAGDVPSERKEDEENPSMSESVSKAQVMTVAAPSSSLRPAESERERQALRADIAEVRRSLMVALGAVKRQHELEPAAVPLIPVVDSTIFDAAQREVYGLMSTDTFSRWTLTNDFQELAAEVTGQAVELVVHRMHSLQQEAQALT